MNIIHIVDYLGGCGGVNSFVYDLSAQQAAMGHTVSIVGILKEAWNKDRSLQPPEGVALHVLGALSRQHAITYCIPRLHRLLKSIAEDHATICNLHLKLSVLMGAIASIGIRNIVCVETYHSRYSNYSFQQKLLSPRIRKYICCSESARVEMRDRFNPKAEKLFAIPNGVNTASIKSAALTGHAGSKHSIQIVSVGRLSVQKNFAVTASAFSELKGDVLYRIIGEGELRDEIVAASKESKNIEMPGTFARNDVFAEVAQADIVVMPSLWEGLSIFMLEAMALNRPLMLSNIPAFRNIFDEPELEAQEAWRLCKWGYLVDVSNTRAYREAILHFLAHPELHKKMQEKISMYSQRYNIIETARLYISVYNSVLDNNC